MNFALVRFLDEGQIIRLDVVRTIAQIFIIIIIPITIGMVIRRHSEGFAMRMARPVRIASAFVIALVIIGIVIKERANFVSYFQQAGIAALVLNVATMAVGYYSARLFGIKDKQALSISIESGIQNGTLAISIAVILLHSTAFSIAPGHLQPADVFYRRNYSLLWFEKG